MRPLSQPRFGEVAEVVEANVAQADRITSLRPLRGEVGVEQWAASERREDERARLDFVDVLLDVCCQSGGDRLGDRNGPDSALGVGGPRVGPWPLMSWSACTTRSSRRSRLTCSIVRPASSPKRRPLAAAVQTRHSNLGWIARRALGRRPT